MTDAELRTYYENHKADYLIPSKFPPDIFTKGARPGQLTPPIYRQFDEVKRSVEVTARR